jgi:hypothetical protein
VRDSIVIGLPTVAELPVSDSDMEHDISSLRAFIEQHAYNFFPDTSASSGTNGLPMQTFVRQKIAMELIQRLIEGNGNGKSCTCIHIYITHILNVSLPFPSTSITHCVLSQSKHQK